MLGQAERQKQLSPGRAGLEQRQAPDGLARIAHADRLAGEAEQRIERVAVLAAKFPTRYAHDRMTGHDVEANEVTVGNQVASLGGESGCTRQPCRHLRGVQATLAITQAIDPLLILWRKPNIDRHVRPLPPEQHG